MVNTNQTRVDDIRENDHTHLIDLGNVTHVIPLTEEEKAERRKAKRKKKQQFKTRFWRVEAIHTRGYKAPSVIIETTADRLWKAELEALTEAKSRSRLADFECWSFEATLLERKKLNGKLLTYDEYSFKTGLVLHEGRWMTPEKLAKELGASAPSS